MCINLLVSVMCFFIFEEYVGCYKIFVINIVDVYFVYLFLIFLIFNGWKIILLMLCKCKLIVKNKWYWVVIMYIFNIFFFVICFGIIILFFINWYIKFIISRFFRNINDDCVFIIIVSIFDNKMK